MPNPLKSTISIKRHKRYDVFSETNGKESYIGEIREIEYNMPTKKEYFFEPTNNANMSEDDCYNLSVAIQSLNNDVKHRSTCEHCRGIGSVVAICDSKKEIVPCIKCQTIEDKK